MSEAAAVLEGSNDVVALAGVYDAVRKAQPANRSQELFVRAWELTGFIASDGFEWLFEQRSHPDELAAILTGIGFPEGAAFIGRAASMLPKELLEPDQEEARFDVLESSFESFKALLHEYLSVANELLLPALGSFVRRNRGEFEATLS
jgi:hypothetical protein